MVYKYTLIALLALTNLVNGFSLPNLALIKNMSSKAVSSVSLANLKNISWKNFKPTGSAHVYAGLAAVGGATAALAGHYCYTKAAHWCFDAWQNYAAQTYAINKKMLTLKTYVVTVDLKNKKQPLAIHESTRPTNKTYTIEAKIGTDALITLPQVSTNPVWQKVLTVMDNAYVAGKTIAKNPEAIVIPVGAAALLYMLGKPTLKQGFAYAGIGAGIVGLTVKAFLKEKKQSHQDVLVIQAVNAILDHARTNKLKKASYTVTFDFAKNAATPIAITKESVLKVTHSNAHLV